MEYQNMLNNTQQTVMNTYNDVTSLIMKNKIEVFIISLIAFLIGRYFYPKNKCNEN